MKKTLAALGILLAVGTTWAQTLRELPPPHTAGKVELTALAKDKTGAPALAWTEEHQSRQVHAATWAGGQWQVLGGIINEDPAFNAAQLMARTDFGGRLWLGWAEDAGIAHVDSWIMSVWDGGAWHIPAAPVRRNLSDAGRSRSFDVLPSGVPTLAWTDIHVPGAWASAVRPLSWDGKTWQPEAVLNQLKFAGFNPDIRTQKSGLRTLVFLEGDYASMNVIVMQEQAAGKWQRLGEALNHRKGTFSTAPKLLLSPWGQPLVAWIEANGDLPDRVCVSRWDGQKWVSLGSPAGFKHSAEALAVALSTRGVRTAWLEDGVLHAAEWDGHRWATLPLPKTKNATGPSLSPDGKYLAVSDGGQLRVWAWP